MVAMRALRSLLSVVLLVALVFGAALIVVFEMVPRQNTAEKHFDTLIVLGTPAKLDGTPTPELRERIDEGVREYKAGVAPHLIMTGGAAHNKLVEGQVMADYAVGEGVPRDAIVVEGQAKDTIQNIWYSHILMQKNGWHSAEVISSPYHLPRTAMILQHYRGPLALDWSTHAAHWPPEYSVLDRLARDYHEAYGMMRIRVSGFRPTPYLPQ